MEIVRFVAIIFIMSFHSFLIGYGADRLFKNCWVWVDYFFILSGAFTYRHFTNNKCDNIGSSALQYTFNKFRRFLPYTIVSVVILSLAKYSRLISQLRIKDFIKAMIDVPFEIMYLTSSGISKPINEPLWFLSAMFIVLPLIAYCIQAVPELWKVLSLLIPILYFGHFGVNTVRSWPNDLLRAVACVSLGTFAFLLSIRVKETTEKSSKCFILFSVIEIVCLIVVIYIGVFNKKYVNLTEPLFLLIVSLQLSQCTTTSYIKHEIIGYLGKISMPMYIFHWSMGAVSKSVTDDMVIRIIIYYLGTIVLSFISLCISEYISKRKTRRCKENEATGVSF